MAEHRKPGVAAQPNLQSKLQRGFGQIVAAVRPTLGPYPRLVAYDHNVGAQPPEFLDDGGMIARRIIQLPHRTEDVGAMFLRQVLWRVRQRVGDGTATTAVLFDFIYSRGARYIAAGGNAMVLRPHLEAGMRLIDAALARLSISIKEDQGRPAFARLAHSLCPDPDLARQLDEMFKVISPYGIVDIRTGHGLETHWEYVEGTYWPGGLLSRQFETDTYQMRAELSEAAILISDVEVKEPQDLLPILKAVMDQSDIKALLLVVKSLPDLAVHLLCSESTRQRLRVIAAKTPYTALTSQALALEDLARLAGGRPIISQAGQTLRDARLEDLGRARRVWADRHNFGLVDGLGDQDQLLDFLGRIGQAHQNSIDAKEHDRLQERLGKLVGGSATLWIGGATKSELETRRQLAIRAVKAMRVAMLAGVLPGGGAALLACQPIFQKRLKAGSIEPEQVAWRILHEALEAPVRALLTNAGHEPARILDEIRRAGSGFGFDLHSRRVVNMLKAGIFDTAAMQRDAVRSAITSAALALTIDTVVHHREPALETEP